MYNMGIGIVTVFVETHILNKFDGDLYGRNLKTILLQYLRPEKNFNGLDALVAEINNDIEVASKQLEEPKMLKYKIDSFFKLENPTVKNDSS